MMVSFMKLFDTSTSILVLTSASLGAGDLKQAVLCILFHAFLLFPGTELNIALFV